MRVSELKRDMDERFTRVDARFVELKTDMDERFTQVDARFVELETDMDRRFVEVQTQIAAEGEATRRYFDVVAEQFRSEVRLLYDKLAAIDETTASNRQEHATFQRALDDHEVRLNVLERPGQ